LGLLLALAVLGAPLPTAAPASAVPVSAAPVSAAPVSTAPTPGAVQDPGPSGEPYRIHAADQLAVEVFGDTTLSQTVTVLPGGDIYYP
jgi:protein involved in polysaccharide export with SLBB domain